MEGFRGKSCIEMYIVRLSPSDGFDRGTVCRNDIVWQHTFDGAYCRILGNPRILRWNGKQHNFQGHDGERSYDETPSYGSSWKEMPFDTIGEHSRTTNNADFMGLQVISIDLYKNESVQCTVRLDG